MSAGLPIALAALGALTGAGTPWLAARFTAPPPTSTGAAVRPVACGEVDAAVRPVPCGEVDAAARPVPCGEVDAAVRPVACGEAVAKGCGKVGAVGRAVGWAAVGAVVFGGLGVAPDVGAALPAFLAVAAIGLVLAVVDLACLRLPDPLVGLAALAAVVGLVTAATVTGRPDRLLGPLAGAALSFTAYALLALLPRSRLGFGDVKLAAVLGLPLGWLGRSALLAGLLLPHVLHGLAVLGLLATRRARRDTLLPLGPALLSATWLAALLT